MAKKEPAPEPITENESERDPTKSPEYNERFFKMAYEKLGEDPLFVPGLLEVHNLTMDDLTAWCKANDLPEPEGNEMFADVPIKQKFKLNLNSFRGLQSVAEVLSGYQICTVSDLQGRADKDLFSLNGIDKDSVDLLNKTLRQIGIKRNPDGTLTQIKK